MSHYRKLNEELICEVQKKREELKLCFNEILRLKREVMERHESELNLRNHCYNFAVNSFVKFIESVKPDSNILPTLIKEQVGTQGTLLPTDGRVTRTSTTSSEAPRNSSILTKEFQLSNSVINLRRSLCSTSPIRRSSRRVSELDEELKSPPPQDNTKKKEIEKTYEWELSETATAPPSPLNPVRDIIYEYSDEEEETEEVQEIYDDSVYESLEEVVGTSHTRSTLGEVTNTLASINLSTQENTVSKTGVNRGRPKKIKILGSNDQENVTNNNTIAMKLGSDSDIDQTGSRKRLSDRNVIDIEEEPLQHVRRNTNEGPTSDANKSLPINKRTNLIHNEISVNTNSPTSIYNDISLRNFKDAACSTPNSQRNSLINSTESCTKTELSVGDSQSETKALRNDILVRPSRQCRPKCLVEPSSRIKMRNESQTTTKNKSKTRSKSKTKK